MWEFRDQRLDKPQHQRLFQLAISGSTKQWVSREQLLEAVRGAGMADVMNAAMNSAWTHWLPGEHRNCSGTLTKAAHAPPGGTREHCLSRKRYLDHFLALPFT